MRLSRTNSRRGLESIQGYHLSRANYQQPQPLWNSDVICLFLLVKQGGRPKHVTETEITLQWIHYGPQRPGGEFHEDAEHSPIGWPVVDTHTPLVKIEKRMKGTNGAPEVWNHHRNQFITHPVVRKAAASPAQAAWSNR